MNQKTFTGRNGLTFGMEMLKTILITRSLSVKCFGVPTPKFKNHQHMKDWAEEQIAIHHAYINNLTLLHDRAIECLNQVLQPCPECSELIKS